MRGSHKFASDALKMSGGSVMFNQTGNLAVTLAKKKKKVIKFSAFVVCLWLVLVCVVYF